MDAEDTAMKALTISDWNARTGGKELYAESVEYIVFEPSIPKGAGL